MKNENEVIRVFYGNDDYQDPQTLAKAESEYLSVISIDVRKTPLTGTQLLQMADKLGVAPSEMVNKELKDYKKVVSRSSYSTEDWIQILLENPHLLRTIAQRGDRMIFVDSPTDIKQLGRIDQDVDNFQKF